MSTESVAMPTRSVSTQTLTAGTLTASMAAISVAAIGQSILAVINGYVLRDLRATSAQLTWISASFLVTVAVVGLTFGVVGDLWGRKRLLAAGSALMAAGSLLAFLTPPGSVGILVAAQIISGVGAGAVGPTSIAMLAAETHTMHARARAIAIWAAALTGAGLASPVIAGAMVRIPHPEGGEASWRYAFLANAIFATISVLLTLMFAHDSRSPHGRSLDLPGQATIALAAFALLYGVINGGQNGFVSANSVTAYVVAVLSLGLFVVVERRRARPLIQLELFANRVFGISAVVTVLTMFAFLGTAYATSIRLSAIQDHVPLVASTGIVCLNIFGLFFFPVSARLVRRVGPGWVLATGGILIGAGDFVLASIPATNPSIAAVVAPLFVVGAGFKLAVTSVTAVAVNSVPASKAGMAGGATSMLRDLGFSLGPAIISSVALAHASHEIAGRVVASPKLSAALDKFYASPAHAPADKRAAAAQAVGAVKSGPLGANAVPASIRQPDGSIKPFNPLKDVAMHALSSGYAVGYVICGAAALAAAILALAFIGRRRQEDPELAQERG